MKNTLVLFHPFFFAIYPILALRNYNIDYVDAASVFRPMLLSVLMTGFMVAAFKILTRDWQKAGILATLAVVQFFSYGHVYLEYESMFGRLPRYSILTLVFGGIFILSAIWITWKLRNPGGIAYFLAVTGGLLLAFSLFQTLQHDLAVQQQAATASAQNLQVGLDHNTINDRVERPDIYFILLDAHTRTDILWKDYGYDNSAFIRQLRDLGFYVAECAQSNYPSTKLSVTSTFYMDYHKEPTLYPVSSSQTIQTVRSLGYRVITFENRSNGHFDIGEDMRLSRNQMAFGRIVMTGGLSEFDMMLLSTSFLRIAIDMPQLVPGLDENMLKKTEFYEHYQQTLYILDELKRLPEVEGPKFIFAHILVPHPPFIFSADGSFDWAENGRAGYVANTQFIDSSILPVFKEIIARSKIPPVIILMGDHGPTIARVTPEMRMAILNAYYVNNEAKKDLYPAITPVNSFRVVFNNYFGTDYPLLEDKSYYAYGMNKFTPDALIPNKCKGSQ